MKQLLYSFLVGATVLTFAISPTPAQASRHLLTDAPAATERKAAAQNKAASKKTAVVKHAARKKNSLTAKMRHGMRVMLGLEPSKAVTSPRKLSRHMFANQRQLRSQNRAASRSRWGLCK